MKRRKWLINFIPLLTGATFSCITSRAEVGNRVPLEEKEQEGSGGFVLYSSLDKGKEPVARLTEGLRLSVLKGKALKIDEDIKISGTIQVPATARVLGGNNWIFQDKNLTPLFMCDGPGARRFENINCRGVGSDYVNSSAVYSAAGVVARSGASVDIEKCQLINFAGAGVRLMAGAVNCKVIGSRITGAGRDYIASKTSNYGACVVVEDGVQKWTIDGCDLSLSAQGIVTGDDLADIQITRNQIHDIAGQHGAYIESVKNIVVSKNVFFDIPLQAIKIQIGSVRATDADRILIEENVISRVGSHAILLTNPVGNGARLKNFTIRKNTFNSVGESAISLNNCSDGLIESNEIQSVGRGLYVDSCGMLSVVKNSIQDATKESSLSVNMRNSSFRENYFYTKATDRAEGGGGISFTGASTEGIELKLNKMEGAIPRKILMGKINASRFHFEGNNFTIPDR
ncbi:right-handed parallel beta-helix repeat-containing protein [Variovorax sp. Root318D1]|uniref:right-handed parallel beta-helix repeat-containing protein n=1 Tax=Variovorax sp. Root318D1 TaxID=1736513 RepID=UPI0009E92DDC|nr:right-handed parallel beta-helix repeat-containing protein [Variovorax sp. Root318D1]